MRPGDLPELDELSAIIALGGSALEARIVREVEVRGKRFPVWALALGNPDPALPAAGYFAGVHGLERIGTQVLLAYLRSLLVRLRWDAALHRQLDMVRLVFMPLINPGGMWRGRRSNPNGVDLMRNAPIDAVDKAPLLLGGHRLGPVLPWYRGSSGAPMEIENQAVCEVVDAELLRRRFSVALDLHSGFGLRDRVWFPWAHSRVPVKHLADIHAFWLNFEATYPQHDYLFEPQCHAYVTHGDLWDHLNQRAEAMDEVTFLPFTLEMGSWLWIKKNPRQAFSLQGIFNPMLEHRLQRVLRRHLVWLDYVARAAAGRDLWRAQGALRWRHRHQAIARWYWRHAG